MKYKSCPILKNIQFFTIIQGCLKSEFSFKNKPTLYQHFKNIFPQIFLT